MSNDQKTAAELLREVVEAYSVNDLKMWFETSANEGAPYQNVARALTAARAWLEENKADVGSRESGRAEVGNASTMQPGIDRSSTASGPMRVDQPTSATSPAAMGGTRDEVIEEMAGVCDARVAEYESNMPTHGTARSIIRAVAQEAGECAEALRALMSKPLAMTQPGEVAGGLWRCEACGEAYDACNPRWRTAEVPEHKCGDAQAGHFTARWFGSGPPVNPLAAASPVSADKRDVEALERVGPPPQAERSARGVTPRTWIARRYGTTDSYEVVCADAGYCMTFPNEALARCVADSFTRYEAEIANPSGTPNTSSAPTAFVEAAKALLHEIDKPGIKANALAHTRSGDRGFWIYEDKANDILSRAVALQDALASVDAQAPTESRETLTPLYCPNCRHPVPPPTTEMAERNKLRDGEAPAPSPVGERDDWSIIEDHERKLAQMSQWALKIETRLDSIECDANSTGDEIGLIRDRLTDLDARVRDLSGDSDSIASTSEILAKRVQKMDERLSTVVEWITDVRKGFSAASPAPTPSSPKDAKCAGCGHGENEHDDGVGTCTEMVDGDFCTCEEFTPAAVEGREAKELPDVMVDLAQGFMDKMVEPTPPPAETAMADVPGWVPSGADIYAALLDGNGSIRIGLLPMHYEPLRRLIASRAPSVDVRRLLEEFYSMRTRTAVHVDDAEALGHMERALRSQGVPTRKETQA